MIDPDIESYLKDQGYIHLRLMPDGSIAGINPMLFTYGLCTKLDFTGYTGRWCFENIRDAVLALSKWDGKGDPPGPWIKQKGPVERANPKLFKTVAVNSDGSLYTVRDQSVSYAETWV